VLGGDGETYADPVDLYRQWFSNLEDARKPAGGGPTGITNSQEIWRQWMEATTGAWHRALGIGVALLGLAPRWMEMAQEVQKHTFDERGFPTDPLDFYLRWYNATSGPLSKMAGDILKNEAFLETSRSFFENYASFESVFRRAAEEYFGYLQLSTRSDSSRIAELVVGLDSKVDRMEDAFEEFEYGYEEPATVEAVDALEDRIKELERKLDNTRSGLDRVEGKMDQLLAALNAAKGGNS
jgi:hypothetical protein